MQLVLTNWQDGIGDCIVSASLPLGDFEGDIFRSEVGVGERLVVLLFKLIDLLSRDDAISKQLISILLVHRCHLLDLRVHHRLGESKQKGDCQPVRACMLVT